MTLPRSRPRRRRLHPDRAAGGDRDHRRLDRPASAGGAGRPRGGAPLQCANNLKQIGLGLANYESANGTLPMSSILQYANPATDVNPIFKSYWSVVGRITPFLEQGALFNQINFAWKSSDPPNMTAAEYRLNCPHLPERPEHRP